MAATNKPLQLLHTQRQSADEAPTLYVFGNEDNEGYVVIAGDDVAVSSVLGYSRTGTFDIENIPCNLRNWLEEYGRQLTYARKNLSSIKAFPRDNIRESISPLITSKWDQGAPYNNLCPIDSYTGGRCATGCVATALAQIMYYHKWPEQGVSSYSYDWNGQTLSADFGATTYQWNKMEDTYSVDDNDPDDAVATLMYHCGVALNMGYGPYESGVWVYRSGYNSTERDVLTKYFNYSGSVTTTGCSDAILYNELYARRPVLIGGGSHTFICDGYENGYFHFNFGWGGYCDDYFLLSAIKPEGHDYSNNQSITYGIRKAGNMQTIDDIRYELYDDGTALIVRGEKEGGYGDYTIPSSIQFNGKNYEVTAIGHGAFQLCDMSSLTIPNSITFIGWGAFGYCNGLEHVTIPNSVIKIGDHAFEQCYSLTSVTIPNSVAVIGDGAFVGCGNLSSINIPNSVVYIGSEAFMNCSSLTSVIIPSSVTEIGINAFSGCSSLITPIYSSTSFVYMPPTYTGEYIIPNGITTICPSAFKDCSGLTYINIPNSVTSIGSNAFYGCNGLTSLTIPNSVTEIGGCAFQGCNGLTSVQVESDNTIYDSRDNCNAIIETASNTLIAGCNHSFIPDGVEAIGLEAFRGCTALTSIIIPNSVQNIDYWAFEGCSGLTSVTISQNVEVLNDAVFQGCSSLKSLIIPQNVTFISNTAFKYCSGLTSIQVEDTNTVFDSRENCNAIIETESNTLIKGCKNTIIPNGIESISYDAFTGCTGLISLTIPNSVTSIDNYAFSYCTNLNSISIPRKITTIASGVFYGCSNLTSVTISNSVSSIGWGAFCGCSSLTEIYCYGSTVPEADPGAFDSLDAWDLVTHTNIENVTLHVPIASIETYKSIEPWSKFCHITSLIVPVEDEAEIMFSDDIAENTDLSNTIIENTYYNINSDNGDGYDAEEQAIVMNTATTEEQMSTVQDAEVGDDVVTDNYSGIIFEVPAGGGTIAVDACTIGTHVLNVQIGNSAPTKVTKSERGTVEITYKVTEPTYVYLYASTESVSAASPRRAAGDNSVLLYGYTVAIDYLHGDANADKKVTITDAVGIVNKILGNPSSGFNEAAADVNGDKQITITDAVGVVNIILNNGSE